MFSIIMNGWRRKRRRRRRRRIHCEGLNLNLAPSLTMHSFCSCVIWDHE
jgi:hypothetical protein